MWYLPKKPVVSSLDGFGKCLDMTALVNQRQRAGLSAVLQTSTLRHLVLIPSYNSGTKLSQTVQDALRYFHPVWVVIDGSTDGSDGALATLDVKIILRLSNGGKGAAVFDGLREAAVQNFTHVLVMDADGQHPAWLIPNFMRDSQQNPRAMILGMPVFDASAPHIRVLGRRISNVLTRWETLRGIGDSLFGFRVYPLAELLSVMESTRWMRGFDFDAEAVVRLSWRGVPVINLPAPVRYFSKADGGVSHFRYGRDNILLAKMHVRLMVGALFRLFSGWIASLRSQ